jgi:hypothetical protein
VNVQSIGVGLLCLLALILLVAALAWWLASLDAEDDTP